MPLLPDGEYRDVPEQSPHRRLYVGHEIQIDGIETFGWQHAKHIDEAIPWHYHRDCFEFHYLIQGTVTFLVDHKEYLMKAGDVFVTFPNEFHRSGDDSIIFRNLYWFSVRFGDSLLNLDPVWANYLMEQLHQLRNRIIPVGNEMKDILKHVFENITAKEEGRRMYASLQMASFLYRLVEYDRCLNTCTLADRGFRTSPAIPVAAGDAMYFGAAVTTQGWHLVTMDAGNRVTGAARLSSGISIVENLDDTTSIMKYTVGSGVAYLRFVADARYVNSYLVTKNAPFTGTDYLEYFKNPSTRKLTNLFDPSDCQIGWIYWRNHDEQIISKEIDGALNFIEQNKKRSISLEEVAQSCNLSVSHFKRRFKNETGITPAFYIQKQRIECAKELLKAGYSITKVAHELDFCSSNYFSVVFRRVTLMTPSQYIQNIRSCVSGPKMPGNPCS